MKGFLKTVGSLRITVAVVLLVVGFSVYGTFLRQEEAMASVYRSPLFVGLLSLFGLNLFACTLLRLRPRLAQAGFLATHLGVLVILAGAIAGAAGGDRGNMQLKSGGNSGAYYRRVRVEPGKNLKRIESELGNAGGRIVERNAESVTVTVPRANVHALMQALGRSLTFEVLEAEEDTAAVRFWPGVEIVRKSLPFT